jgi:hypothetical protein
VNVKLPGRESFTKYAAAAMLLLGSLSSCGELTTTPTDPGKQNVMFGVITSKDIPLAGVEVSGGTETVTSDATGNYRTYLPPGDSTVVFTKTGYAPVSKPVTAGTKSEIKADIVMITQKGGGESYTVTPGSYQRVLVTAPGKISFTVVGVNMDLDKDAWPIVYFYDHKGYTGGKGGSGGFNGELRSYKLKYYDASGVIASESYYVEPKGNTPRWDPKVARSVTLEWGTDFVMSTVDGIPFRKSSSVAGTFTLGIGYPPAVRPGWDGAVYTNVVWPAGSTKIK